MCHTIPGIPGAVGKQGPLLEEGTNAPNRIKDAAYKGAAHRHSRIHHGVRGITQYLRCKRYFLTI